MAIRLGNNKWQYGEGLTSNDLNDTFSYICDFLNTYSPIFDVEIFGWPKVLLGDFLIKKVDGKYCKFTFNNNISYNCHHLVFENVYFVNKLFGISEGTSNFYYDVYSREHCFSEFRYDVGYYKNFISYKLEDEDSNYEIFFESGDDVSGYNFKVVNFYNEPAKLHIYLSYEDYGVLIDIYWFVATSLPYYSNYTIGNEEQSTNDWYNYQKPITLNFSENGESILWINNFTISNNTDGFYYPDGTPIHYSYFSHTNNICLRLTKPTTSGDIIYYRYNTTATYPGNDININNYSIEDETIELVNTETTNDATTYINNNCSNKCKPILKF